MPGPLVLSDLRGGLFDGESLTDLQPDQVSVVTNVDWNRASLGGKRRGCSPVNNGYNGAATSITFLFRHNPVNDERLTELWAAGVTSSGGALDYRDATGWHAAAFSPDGLILASGAFGVDMQSLHGKLFVAYPAASGGSPVDRLHVRLSTGGLTTLRRAGLSEPAAPSLGDTAAGGSYSGLRYARVRYTVQESGTTTRRSEPSDAASITPVGNKTGITITRPALMGEGETHWEVELSLDNANWYRVTTLAIATGTYDDTTAYTTGYAAAGVVSPDVGDYTPPWSCKFLAADDDRLLMAGAWVDASKASRVGWTPVGLSPGVGNDERLEEDTDPFLDLDGYDGGELTAFTKSPSSGYFFAFKNQSIYKIARTGIRAKAYEAIALTKKKGALPRTAVVGVEETGNACVLFADPAEGPHRIGSRGIEDIGDGVRNTWARVNKDATLVAHSVFYPKSQQWWLWVALDEATTPSHILVLHCKYARRREDGTVRGWSLYDGKLAKALTACLYADNIPTAPQSLDLAPYVGFANTVASGAAIIQQADTGQTDDTTPYRGYYRTRPFLLGNLVQKKGIDSGAIIAPPASGETVNIKLIRDCGLNSKSVAPSLTATGSQTRVIRHLDDLELGELEALEIEIGDTAVSSGTWALDQLSLWSRDEERK